MTLAGTVRVKPFSEASSRKMAVKAFTAFVRVNVYGPDWFMQRTFNGTAYALPKATVNNPAETNNFLMKNMVPPFSLRYRYRCYLSCFVRKKVF